MAKKEKQHLTGMRRGIRILGIFHIVVGCFWLFITVMSALIVRPETFGETFKSNCPPVLSFIHSWDNTLTGGLLMVYMLIISATEFFIGRIWRKKALTTKGQMLTLVFSGFKSSAHCSCFCSAASWCRNSQISFC